MEKVAEKFRKLIELSKQDPIRVSIQLAEMLADLVDACDSDEEWKVIETIVYMLSKRKLV